MIKKIAYYVGYTVVFFVLTFGIMHLIAAMEIRDLTLGEPAFKGEFFIITVDKNNDQVSYHNTYDKEQVFSISPLIPAKNSGSEQIEDRLYSYKILSKQDNQVVIETRIDSDDYILVSKYAVEHNKIIALSSYLYSFDYMFLSLFISLVLIYFLRKIRFKRTVLQ